MFILKLRQYKYFLRLNRTIFVNIYLIIFRYIRRTYYKIYCNMGWVFFKLSSYAVAASLLNHFIIFFFCYFLSIYFENFHKNLLNLLKSEWFNIHLFPNLFLYNLIRSNRNFQSEASRLEGSYRLWNSTRLILKGL